NDGRIDRTTQERDEEAIRTWHGTFSERVDPTELALRSAGVVLSLATGPHRQQEAAWEAATEAIVRVAEEWVSEARRAEARRHEARHAPPPPPAAAPGPGARAAVVPAPDPRRRGPRRRLPHPGAADRHDPPRLSSGRPRPRPRRAVPPSGHACSAPESRRCPGRGRRRGGRRGRG